ncbi:hypothetical protein PR048_025973 [Dryococelus australis]|uniref:RNA-directed DNA polymerase n=1 Tax=Dryococelus australis TaxID=614101 RepID=A0ABQ9GK35_9NEOP|nr:hypothetical protein PR048_025973 [Dryococelus australis]
MPHICNTMGPLRMQNDALWPGVCSRSLPTSNDTPLTRHCSMDDILIHASTKAELKDITKKVILKLKQAGLQLNAIKCIFDKEQVKFLGHIITSKGKSPDPAKIATIEQIRKPTIIQEVQRFHGMVNYLSKFIPNVSKLSTPLRQLLEKNVAWHWENDQNSAFETLKRCLKFPPVLTNYDYNKPVTLSVDASSHSVSSVLLQENQPIAYAFKALTKVQLNYSQIEKEALAILTACKKFHQYIWGKKNLQIESDHIPLKAIFKKSLLNAPTRLERILFEVLPYNPTVIYVKGSQLYIVDALSRDCHNTPEVDIPLTFEIHVLIPLSKERTMELEELAVYKDVIFKGAQTLIPSSMKGLVLSHLHHFHKGIIGTLKLARDHVFWPGMLQDITEFVQKCVACKLSQGNPTQEHLTLKGDYFLIIADNCSGCFDFTLLQSTTHDAVMRELKRWFSQHGIPDELRTDGGSQYSSHEFEKFRREWNFRHCISSPHFPRFNGLAERYVQESKNRIRKCYMDDTDTMLALLHLRNIPGGKSESPSQRLMGHRTRTFLPTSEKLLQPALVKCVKHNLKSLRQANRNTFNQNRTLHPPLLQSDDILYREAHKHWVLANIVQPVPKSGSYIIDTPNGRYRRNSWFIKPRGASLPAISTQVNGKWPVYLGEKYMTRWNKLHVQLQDLHNN